MRLIKEIHPLCVGGELFFLRIEVSEGLFEWKEKDFKLLFNGFLKVWNVVVLPG